MRFKVELELGRRRERKSESGPYTGGATFLGPRSLSATRLRSYVEAYRISEVVRSCVDKINLAAKGIPWYLYQRRGKETVEIESHPLLTLLRHSTSTCGP
jgi:hypothetical protein